MSLSKILFLLEEGVKIKNQLALQISKEKNAKTKRKLQKAIRKAVKTNKLKHLDRIRELLFKP